VKQAKTPSPSHTIPFKHTSLFSYAVLETADPPLYCALSISANFSATATTEATYFSRERVSEEAGNGERKNGARTGWPLTGVGKTLASQMRRLEVPWTRREGATTPF
jgi:hypothetical protein